MKSTKLFLFLVFFLASCAAPAISTIVPAQTFTLEPTATQQATATQTLIPTPSITPSPTQIGGGSGRLIFTYRKDDFMQDFPDLKGEINIFVMNVDGTNLTSVTNGLEGYNYLKDISPDGNKVLIASTSQEKDTKASLYLVNRSLASEPVKLAEGVPNFYGTNSSAKWLDATNIVYVGQGNSGFGIYKLNVDTNTPESIYQFNNDGEEYRPFEILAIDLDNARIYWDTHSKTPGLAAMIDVYTVWWSSLDGNGERTPLEFNGKQLQFTYGGLAFSPDGNKVAWKEETTPPALHIASVLDIDNPFTLETISSQFTMTWFPDSSKIVVFDEGSLPMSWEECGKEPAVDTANDSYGVYEVLVTPNVSIKNYHLPIEKMMTCESWGGNANYMRSVIHGISPDGRQVLWRISRSTTDGIDSKLTFLNLETLLFSETSNPVFSKAIREIHWIP